MGMPEIGPVSVLWPSSKPPPATGTGGAFPVAGQTASVFLSTVSHSSTTRGMLLPAMYGSLPAVLASPIRYLRVYKQASTPTQHSYDAGRWPDYTQNCYLSANLYHATVTGLSPNTRYFFIVGNATAGYSHEFSFLTPPNPLAPTPYPFSIGMIGDTGQTVNTSANLGNLALLHPNLVLHPGALSADPRNVSLTQMFS